VSGNEKRLRVRTRSFRERLEEGDTYGLLLILIIVSYFEMGLVGTSHWGKTALSVSFAGILLLTLHTSHVRGRWVRITLVVSVLVVSITIAQAIVDSEAFTGATYIWIGFIVASPVIILNRIFRHPAVDLETILGAVCSYLLIGIAFASVYGMMQAVGSENFFAQPGSHSRLDYLYFSFIVLTTTGFGDLTPGTPVGKVLVTLEALIGQVFLVTIVASLVSSFVGIRGRRPPSDDASDGGGSAPAAGDHG
jgi:Ion channel